METKDQSTNVNTNTNVNHNTNIVNFPIPEKKRTYNKKKKTNWIVKAIIIAAIGLISSIIIIFVKHSTAANGKPAFIQGGTPADNSK